MKFGKQFPSQMVHEWQTAYMDYNNLKTLLKQVSIYRRTHVLPSPPNPQDRRTKLKRRLSLYRAFSGLTSPSPSPSRNGSPEAEDEVILVTKVQPENAESEGSYQTRFLMPTDEGGAGEVELEFFRKLDDEFNKVSKFYKQKVSEVKAEAEELTKQMDALIALRVKVEYPLLDLPRGHSTRSTSTVPSPSEPSPKSPVFSSSGTRKGMPHMDAIQEAETSNEDVLMDGVGERAETANGSRFKSKRFTPPPLEILNQVRINIESETPVSTLKTVFNYTTPYLSFSEQELKKAEKILKWAFIEFHHKLQLLKSYSFMNVLAFSKIMKKYDKVTSRHASKSYLEMIENSSLGKSDEIARLTERVESTVVKHFANGNQSEGMKFLRHQAKRERHRVTFFMGLFCGCTIALGAALIVTLHARHLLEDSQERNQYMENIFPLYSFFGYIALHLILFSGNIYLWRRFRVNYPFIFGYKEGKGSMGYRDILLVASGLVVLVMAGVITNLNLEMDPETKSYETASELLPLSLVIVVLAIVFCPLNIMYRSTRFFLIRSSWHCLSAPLYKVTLPDFFLADQLTSQIQALRCLEFYVCYYGWGDLEKRSNTCRGSRIYQIFYIIVAVLPFWSRFLQSVRRWFEGEDNVQLYNSLKYFSTIAALVLRTLFDPARPILAYPGLRSRQIIVGASSGFTTIFNGYWDIVMDWGLLERASRNPWLRDKLLIPNKNVYYAAMVANSLLRLVWMQLVLDFQFSFLHRTAMVAVIACLEILRRGIWNFFRLENEHLNNVGKYRAFKSVPLPFYYDDDDEEEDKSI